MQKEKDNLALIRDEIFTKRHLLEKEVNLLKEKFQKAEKEKMENEIYNSKALSEYEFINRNLNENNKKISYLQVNKFYIIF